METGGGLFTKQDLGGGPFHLILDGTASADRLWQTGPRPPSDATGHWSCKCVGWNWIDHRPLVSTNNSHPFFFGIY